MRHLEKIGRLLLYGKNHFWLPEKFPALAYGEPKDDVPLPPWLRIEPEYIRLDINELLTSRQQYMQFGRKVAQEITDFVNELWFTRFRVSVLEPFVERLTEEGFTIDDMKKVIVYASLQGGILNAKKVLGPRNFYKLFEKAAADPDHSKILHPKEWIPPEPPRDSGGVWGIPRDDPDGTQEDGE